MGLGKTVQTLTFLAALKAKGLPGPHLIVTPLAVLQNWANEIKRFTPGLSFVKVHGGTTERDRLLTDPAVLEATYDIYLTTYDTLRAEEAFFTEVRTPLLHPSPRPRPHHTPRARLPPHFPSPPSADIPIPHHHYR